MNWDERIAYNRRWVQLHEGNSHQAEAARRMTALLDAMEALLSEESIERAALGIHASHDRGDWDEELPAVQGEYLDMARAGLARLMGGESNE